MQHFLEPSKSYRNNENEKLKDYLITNEYSISHTHKRFTDVKEK